MAATRPGRLFYLVGPSGSGKDTLLNCLKQHSYSVRQPLVAHRYITRAVTTDGENHIELSDAGFERRRADGLFLFDWESHGYRYAVGVEVVDWLARGFHVIMNGSREYLPKAREIRPDLEVVWLRVSDDVLRRRLLDRGRESVAQIDARINRNHALEQDRPPDCRVVSNDSDPEQTVATLLRELSIDN